MIVLLCRKLRHNHCSGIPIRLRTEKNLGSDVQMWRNHRRQHTTTNQVVPQDWWWQLRECLSSGNPNYFRRRQHILDFAIPENGNLSEWDWYKGTYKCELDNGYSKETAEVVLEVKDFVTTERGGIGDYWWILLIIAAMFLFFIITVCCCFCCFRNKGDVYLGNEFLRSTNVLKTVGSKFRWNNIIHIVEYCNCK